MSGEKKSIALQAHEGVKIVPGTFSHQRPDPELKIAANQNINLSPECKKEEVKTRFVVEREREREKGVLWSWSEMEKEGEGRMEKRWKRRGSEIIQAHANGSRWGTASTR